MNKDDIIVQEIKRSVLKNFVCELARKEQIVQDGCEQWAIDLYDYIKNIQEIGATK